MRLGTLVTGNTYRNPALLAKIVTTLDVISRGRAILGIGAGWFEPEHLGYGFDFPPMGERLSGSTRRSRSSARCCAASARASRAATTARRGAERAAAAPPGRPADPDRRHRRAAHAAARREVRRREQLDLRAARSRASSRRSRDHCAAVGRDAHDRQDLARLGDPRAHARARPSARDDFLARAAWTGRACPSRSATDRRALVLGDPDTVGELVQREILGAGLDGIVVNLPANGHLPEAIDLAASTLRKALG